MLRVSYQGLCWTPGSSHQEQLDITVQIRYVPQKLHDKRVALVALLKAEETVGGRAEWEDVGHRDTP